MNDVINISLKNKVSKTILEKILLKNLNDVVGVHVDTLNLYIDKDNNVHINGNGGIVVPYAKFASYIMTKL